ncbi:MAG TPA: hypothetical protein VHE55_01385 [Fimbriimonadaceae bacterium]|nr:hypothetical protein [Fimbriimonadaceae bacterium]
MILSLLLPVASAAAMGPEPVVIYDNTATYLHNGMQLLSPIKPNSAEVGDEVRLAGTAREVVELKLRFWSQGTTTATFEARIRFHSIDYDKTTPGPAVVKDGKITGYDLTPPPGPAFYEGPLLKDMKIVPGMNEYSFTIPHVKVPDRFVWTIQAYNGKGFDGVAGPAYYDKPTVGSSDDFFWHSDGGSPWIAYSWGAAPVANLGARILAVEGGGQEKKGNPVIPPASLLR